MIIIVIEVSVPTRVHCSARILPTMRVKTPVHRAQRHKRQQHSQQKDCAGSRHSNHKVGGVPATSQAALTFFAVKSRFVMKSLGFDPCGRLATIFL